jgi:hypothetical protein
MSKRTASLFLAALLVVACAGAGSPSAAPGGSTGIQPTNGPDATSELPSEAAPTGSADATGTEFCSLFTVDEVEAIVGEAVDPGHDAAMGTGCQWDGKTLDAAYIQIQVIDDPAYYNEESLAEGFEKVSGVGEAAFVVPELGGWAAQAQTDAATYAVAVNGGTTTKESAVSLLKTLMERR